MRLIDANALIKKAWNVDTKMGYVQVVDIGDILNAPTIEHQKVGKWIKVTQGTEPEKYMCSFCHRIVETYGIETLVPIRYPYCHCGAKMRSEEDEI